MRGLRDGVDPDREQARDDGHEKSLAGEVDREVDDPDLEQRRSEERQITTAGRRLGCVRR